MVPVLSMLSERTGRGLRSEMKRKEVDGGRQAVAVLLGQFIEELVAGRIEVVGRASNATSSICSWKSALGIGRDSLAGLGVACGICNAMFVSSSLRPMSELWRGRWFAASDKAG